MQVVIRDSRVCPKRVSTVHLVPSAGCLGELPNASVKKLVTEKMRKCKTQIDFSFTVSTRVAEMVMGSSQGTQFHEPFPPGTRALLQNLRSTHEIVFPVHEESPTKPDAGEDDTAAGRIVLQQRGGLIRCILGGWMAALGDEEAKNGAHGEPPRCLRPIARTDAVS